MTREIRVRSMRMGDFRAPDDHPAAGQRIIIVAYLIDHPDARILLDTGLADDLSEADRAVLRPRPRPVDDALAEVGATIGDVDIVVNCHLHADHAGNNRRFETQPIHVQAAELAAAREPDYTSAAGVALDDLDYRATDGDVEVLPGVTIIPTPGHSPGHQSVLVRRPSGVLLLAGQSFRWASEFAMAAYARELSRAGDPDAPDYPAWMERVLGLEPATVAFAHDTAIWRPAILGG